MEKRFRLFLQEHRDGSFTAQALALPAWRTRSYATTRDAAIAAVRSKLEDTVEDYDPSTSGPLTFYEQQELRVVDVALQSKGPPQEPITISVSLVIAVEEHWRGTRYLVTAPRFEGFHLVVSDAAEVEARAREGLAYFTRKWKSEAIVKSDMEGPESLETITLDLTAPDDVEDDDADNATPRGSSDGAADVLRECGLNLTEQAAAGRLGHADRREPLVGQARVTRAGRTANSVLLVGAPGVGKTAIVDEVVERMRVGDAPEPLKGREVWFVTADNLIAGMQYTGQWQGRIQEFAAAVRKGRQIVVMGDPNGIIDAGRWSKSDNNMARFLRPYVASGEVTLICECSPESYAAAVKSEPSFVHAFQRIDVPEPSDVDTEAILQAEARRLAAARNLELEPGALAAVVDLARRFMPYRAFPGKAARLLQALVRDALPGEERSPVTRILQRRDALASFTRATGLPEIILSDDVELREPEVRAFFEERLLGQPDAVAAMVELVTLVKAGLNDPAKPLGSFFFVGPTGVGKTEMAKVLSTFLFGDARRMQRFDMGEYANADALPKLIGSAWEQESEGELTRRVREQPFCVVLLDELEKAHPSVFDALLGVLGEGRLTDAHGRTADFRNTIVIMTSNLGASRRETQVIGFRDVVADDESDERTRAHFRKEAEQFFRPEFFNRIDRIVAFRPLTLPAMRQITRRELGKLLMREGVTRRNLLVEPFDEAVIETLLRQGFHPLYGARPLQREIERMVSLPLARLIVNLRPGQHHLLRFSARDGQIHLSFVRLDPPEETMEEPVAVPRQPEGDLQAIMRDLREVKERTIDEEASPVVQRLRHEVSTLLRRTRAPSFWDEPAAARDIMSRIYDLERVLKRLDGVAAQADYLLERGRMMRNHRDRRGVPTYAKEVRELHAEWAYVEMELGGAGAGAGHDQALLRVTPVDGGNAGASEAWAAELLAMYRAWAERKSYEYELVDLGEHAPDDAPRQDGAMIDHPDALYISGGNVYEFLQGEAGIHRREQGAGDERRRALARVQVFPAPPPPGDPARLRPLLLHLLLESSDAGREPDDGGIVRSYIQGRHHYVLDPRTRVRVTDVQAVLRDGQIDAFLLASLRQAAEEVV